MSYKLPCGCIPDASGYGYCGECTSKLREKIWREMSKERRAYDRRFAPSMTTSLDKSLPPDDADYNTGCSCHINPPCSYCMSKNNEDENDD